MQREFLCSSADILFAGGAAGSLKTESMIVDAAQESLNPNLRAILFRRTLTEMADIEEKTRRLYTPMGAKFRGQPYWIWTFPSGATIRLAFMEKEHDWQKHLGPRYSFLGWDESTRHTEAMIRNMIGRLGSTDRSLRLRVRLTSNPGNVGAAFHKKMFLRGACPVHEPSKCAVPGKLYDDAQWSDGTPLKDEETGKAMTVCFLPGRLSDHDLLGPDYKRSLRQMVGALAKAFEQGCWCQLEGQFFACWDPVRMVVPYASLGINWWDSHFIGMDYGFGRSAAVALLNVALAGGRYYTVGEIVEKEMPAFEFAQTVADRFIVPEINGNRRRMLGVYLGPDSFKDIGLGGDQTVAEQINSILDQYGVAATPASNERIGGWQKLYRLLVTDQWKVADNCPQLIEAIPSRMHDPERPGDLIKVKGDVNDDVSDAWRYASSSYIEESVKPQEMLAFERARELAQAGDLTAAVIRYQQMQQRMNPESQPIPIGRRGWVH